MASGYRGNHTSWELQGALWGLMVSAIVGIAGSDGLDLVPELR
jgi:hypothetical protein